MESYSRVIISNLVRLIQARVDLEFEKFHRRIDELNWVADSYGIYLPPISPGCNLHELEHHFLSTEQEFNRTVGASGLKHSSYRTLLALREGMEFLIKSMGSKKSKIELFFYKCVAKDSAVMLLWWLMDILCN